MPLLTIFALLNRAGDHCLSILLLSGVRVLYSCCFVDCGRFLGHEGCSDARRTGQLPCLLDLLLHQFVTLGEHRLFQFDSNDFAKLFGIKADVMVLAIVYLGIVAYKVDIAQ